MTKSKKLKFLKTIGVFSLLLLLPLRLFAQDEFSKIPLKGKIKSYTINKLSGDSLNPTLVVVKKVTYDKKNRLLTSFAETGRGSQSNEVNIFNGTTVTNYSCRCKDIDAFIKKFEIRDNAELKNMRGYGTGQEPTKFVKITQLDKRGNAAVISNYSETGYKTSEEKLWYDAADNETKKERYDFDGNLEETVLNTYNKARKQISQTINRPKEGEYKYAWSYDKQGNTTEFLTYRNSTLDQHQKYSIADKGTYKEFNTTNVLKNVTYLQKQVYYDAKGNEIKVINFNTDGSMQSRHEFAYDKNGNLKTYSVYYKEDVLSTQYDYTVDAKGNAIEVKKKQLVTYHHPDGRKEPRYEASKYKREIDY